jgi:hypothetical protein
VQQVLKALQELKEIQAHKERQVLKVSPVFEEQQEY